MNEPIFSRDVRASGKSTAGVERRSRAGELHRIRPGAYAESASWDAMGAREQHLLKVRAVARAMSNPIFSHEAAAAIWGIPFVGTWPEQVTVGFEGGSGMSRRFGVQPRRARFEVGDVVVHGGLHVTSPRRTAIDIARSCSFVRGVVALDHVFASGTDRDDVRRWIEARRPFVGVRRLERAIGIARGLSESPLESVSMARFADCSIHLPEQQRVFALPNGGSARVDFYWPDQDVIGEADGQLKYERAEDIWAEKRREDALRMIARRVIRWSWSDAWTARPLLAALERAGIPPARRR